MAAVMADKVSLSPNCISYNLRDEVVGEGWTHCCAHRVIFIDNWNDIHLQQPLQCTPSVVVANGLSSINNA